eukprot:TRINITY_DN189_c0_g1_i13.p1 TRINITY_DN189_c0_g1~~TRINITY_DN189_c0_g1_i13.p1  ORF type:complete len:202 (-),score=31.39 TRINITY_DN189_c0_g1_i13:362-967(-)
MSQVALQSLGFKIRKEIIEFKDSLPNLQRDISAKQAITLKIEQYNDSLQKLTREDQCARTELEALHKEGEELRTLLRKVQLERNVREQVEKDRKQLLAHVKPNSPIGESAQFTNSTLADIRRAVDELVEQGGAYNERLGYSSSLIRHALKAQGVISSEFQTSKHLLVSSKSTHFTDRLLLGIAMVLYLSVCLYVVITRLFH